MRLQGKIAIVTGSTKGIGRAIAIGYASEGASVVVCGRSEDLAHGLADELTRQGKTAVAMRLDVADVESVAGVFDQSGGELVEQVGLFDQVAAGFGQWRQLFDRLDENTVAGLLLCP